MKSPCTRSGGKGQCEECDDGTYTEHANHLKICLKCSLCRSDQEIVRPCTHTQNAECQCKPGRFCHPDEACEVCKKCLRCGDGEEIVRNCTPTTNTECKKTQPKFDSPSGRTVVVVLVVVLLFAVGIIMTIFGVWKWRKRTTDSQSSLPDEMKNESFGIHTVKGGEEGEIRWPSSTNMNPPHRQPEEAFPNLIPVKGEESLRACFEYFEDVSMDYHKRFFRSLGISDNVIKGKDQLAYEDKVHDLLNIWVEKEGRDATLNDLLKALLELNQKLTAETIKERAVQDGHYFCEVQE